MGFEPTTASLEGWNSTTELRPPTVNLPTLHDPSATCYPKQACASSHGRHYRRGRKHLSCVIRLYRLGLVGRQGFEPWKPSGSRFTVCPLCPLGYLPARHTFPNASKDYFVSSNSRTSAISFFRAENQSKPHHAQRPSKTTGLECC